MSLKSSAKVVLFVAVLLGSAARNIFAEESGRLEEINRIVLEESSRLEEINASEGRILDELKSLQSQLTKLDRDEAALAKELGRISSEKNRVADEVGLLEAKYQKLLGQSAIRMRAIYQHDQHNVRGHLLLSRYVQEGSLGQQAKYLSILARYDQTIAAELLATKESTEQRRVDLVQLEASQELFRSKITSQKRAIEERVARKESLLTTLKSERKAKEKALVTLRAEALRLETVMTSLVGWGENKATKSMQEIPGQRQDKAGPFHGEGLLKQKGKLTFPVEGKVVRPFGKQQSSGFKDMIFAKGIEFNTIPSASVKAVAEGKVIFRGQMPGYGKMLILDHGERYYSLYGLLSEWFAEKGEAVAQGQLIARAGTEPLTSNLSSVDKNFYFEIRKNGTPVNPQGFYTVPLEKLGR